MLYHDYEFIRLIEDYLKKIHAREEELAKKQEIVEDQNAIENIEEKGSKKHEQYTCGFCKKLGHNIATCPLKVK
ncbi:20786_t:CDS:2, partial [Gigaspora margarita]